MRSSLTSPPNLLLSSRPGVCVCIQKQAPHFPQFLTFSLKFFSVPFIHPSFFLLLQPLFSYYKCHSIKSSLRYPSLTPSIPHPSICVSARNKTKQNKKILYSVCLCRVSRGGHRKSGGQDRGERFWSHPMSSVHVTPPSFKQHCQSPNTVMPNIACNGCCERVMSLVVK